MGFVVFISVVIALVVLMHVVSFWLLDKIDEALHEDMVVDTEDQDERDFHVW